MIYSAARGTREGGPLRLRAGAGRIDRLVMVTFAVAV